MSYFFTQLRSILGNRYDEFFAAYSDKPRHRALRVNTLKISVENFLELAKKYEGDGVREYGLKPNPLCDRSFYTVVKPSLDPLYHAGLYYMQEPSASAAVSAFSPYIGERVLDLCAAPGGKSTQAAAFMNGGIMFCNEPDGTRRQALSQNLARLGVRNCVVTQATASDYIKAGFAEYFDTLIVDAPCSGGGMMRYETVPYSEKIVAGCVVRQREILDGACELLRRGGYMLYSTCTFAPEEDEENVKYIVGKGFRPIDLPLRAGEERGIDISAARRIYPHNFDGEGHFYCVLEKTSGGACDKPTERVKKRTLAVGDAMLECVDCLGDLRLAPPFPGLDALRAKTKSVGALCGVGDFIKFPAIHALNADELAEVGTVELGMKNAERYIRGEQLDIKLPKGYYVATIDGYALGAVKSAADGTGEFVLKNLYPGLK